MGVLDLHYDDVPAPLLELLRKLMAEEELSPFCLVGGTALALHLGHRVSVDIDLFSDKAFDVERTAGFLSGEYADENGWYVEKSLSYFEDAEQEPDPHDLKGRTWTEVKRAVLESNRL